VVIAGEKGVLEVGSHCDNYNYERALAHTVSFYKLDVGYWHFKDDCITTSYRRIQVHI